MARLPFVLALPRVLRHMPATGRGLVPDDAVTLDAPDTPAKVALAAAREGDWRPAATLLAGAREKRDWLRHGTYAAQLAECALHHTGWFDDWTAAAPRDPGAALVRADLAISRAWEIRTAARARDVSAEQFAAFHTLLADATPLVQEAADLNPGDPSPWTVAIGHAMGLGAPRRVFDAYLASGRACDPHDIGLHTRAVQYLAAKWYGSHEEMFAFAEGAAASAPERSPLRGLPLYAATEYALEHDAGDDGPVAWSRIEEITEAGLRLSALYPAGDRDAAGFRNHLALALIRCDREAEALETFRLIGPHCRRFPWAYMGEPRDTFLTMRRGVRVAVARATPWFGGTVAVPSADGHRDGEVAVGDAGSPFAPDAAHAVSIALCEAPVRVVAEAVLLTGVTLRLAPAPGGRAFVELAPSAEPEGRRGRGGLRSRLIGEGGMVRIAGTFSRSEAWATTVAARSGDAWMLTVLRDGRELAAHTWADADSVPTQEEAAATAAVFAEVYGLADPRPLTAVLRRGDDPRRHLDDALAVLGLPALPERFGTHPESLDGVRGARVVERRSLLRGMKDFMATGTGPSGGGGELPPLR